MSKAGMILGAVLFCVGVGVYATPDTPQTRRYLETTSRDRGFRDPKAQYAAWLRDTTRLDQLCQCCSEELPRGIQP